jgi:hypothetical protein
MNFDRKLLKRPSFNELLPRTEIGNNRHQSLDFLRYLGKIQGKPIDIPATMAYPFTKREVNRCKHTV